MGTTGFGSGNATPVSEFNVYKDAKAYSVVLNSGIPMKIIGLDICESNGVKFTNEQIENISKINEKGKFLAESWSKLIKFKKEKQGQNTIDTCDGVAAAAMICSNFVAEETLCSACCITNDCPSYGEVILYKDGYTYDGIQGGVGKANKCVISKIEPNAYYEIVMDLLKK